MKPASSHELGGATARGAGLEGRSPFRVSCRQEPDGPVEQETGACVPTGSGFAGGQRASGIGRAQAPVPHQEERSLRRSHQLAVPLGVVGVRAVVPTSPWPWDPVLPPCVALVSLGASPAQQQGCHVPDQQREDASASSCRRACQGSRVSCLRAPLLNSGHKGHQERPSEAHPF
ncbi:Cugbp Elav-Like Family Member 5 [Manis pentadactyla]|nr:Cugbp Elav-Like Family Member 5 [Manis pentadactyla]